MGSQRCSCAAQNSLRAVQSGACPQAGPGLHNCPVVMFVTRAGRPCLSCVRGCVQPWLADAQALHEGRQEQMLVHSSCCINICAGARLLQQRNPGPFWMQQSPSITMWLPGKMLTQKHSCMSTQLFSKGNSAEQATAHGSTNSALKPVQACWPFQCCSTCMCNPSNPLLNVFRCAMSRYVCKATSSAPCRFAGNAVS